MGSCLQILGAGRRPVLLPRLHRHEEHVDDHQLMIATELDGRGLAVMVDPDALTAEHARTAMSTQVDTVVDTPPFHLVHR